MVNMNFVEQANAIFARAVKDYHRTDDVDAPIQNPFAEGTIEYDLYLKNWIDTVQWHLEDIIRDPHIEPVAAVALKRRIDKSNQGSFWVRRRSMSLTRGWSPESF